MVPFSLSSWKLWLLTVVPPEVNRYLNILTRHTDALKSANPKAVLIFSLFGLSWERMWHKCTDIERFSQQVISHKHFFSSLFISSSSILFVKVSFFSHLSCLFSFLSWQTDSTKDIWLSLFDFEKRDSIFRFKNFTMKLESGVSGKE